MMVRSQIMQSFVARIWLERTADEDPKWRGHIQHIQGQDEIYFQDLSEMSEFMERVSGYLSPELDEDRHNVVKISKRSQLIKKKPVRGKSDE